MLNINPKVTVDDILNEETGTWSLIIDCIDGESGLDYSLLVSKKTTPDEIQDKLMRDAWSLEENPPEVLSDNEIETLAEFYKASARNVPGLKK